jgi:hypothetical protein
MPSWFSKLLEMLSISNSLSSGFPILFFWQNKKKPSPIFWHLPSPSFSISQNCLLSAHICAWVSSAHPESVFYGALWWKGLNVHRNKFRVPGEKSAREKDMVGELKRAQKQI